MCLFTKAFSAVKCLKPKGFNKNNETKVRLFCEYEKFMKKRLYL